MVHKLSSDHYIFSFAKENKPALQINSGDEVEFETMDCFANQICTKEDKLGTLDWERVNPATGPVYVNGAEAGDVLKITIKEIQIGDQGVVATGKDLGVLGHLMEDLYAKVLPIKDGQVIFNSKIAIPLNPMVGVIGVAPAGEGISCGTPGAHGGNMDTKLIAENAVLYLPVFVDGAFFALGDLHAAMGDGEIGVSGVEVAGKVRVKLEVVKGKKTKNPLVQTPEVTATIASASTLDEAAQIAVEEMANLLQRTTPLSIAEIATLMSAVGNLQVSQVVDPLKTVRFSIPNPILASYGVKLGS
ncbi:MAG: acetamidase [Firmicutes bacterium]|nr:acetamidase [Bacillota bacterium]